MAVIVRMYCLGYQSQCTLHFFLSKQFYYVMFFCLFFPSTVPLSAHGLRERVKVDGCAE